jgi:alginate O-acetyltransferase complex protein AlgI
MLFNTIEFVIFFITVLTTFVIIKHRKFQHLFLLGASYFFFYYSSNYLLTLLIFTTIWDFYFGKMIFAASTIQRKKILLIASLAGNLGLLGFFKYADFAITQFNILGNYFDLGTSIPLLHLALPIAISFYTFHSITYTVGIYRGQLNPTKTFVEYAIFVAFFPQLVAGPILRAKEFLPQLREKIENVSNSRLRLILLDQVNLKVGVTMMAIGFLKKMFFADNIAPLVNDIFKHPVGLDSFTIILGAVGFGIQIYCDFSGYSDIALGAAHVIGFKIPVNFNKPYFAMSPSDFWRRWHISLSTWLRDYLYIPLGGNKKSKPRTYLNLIIVMFLGGLWHGASWNFVVWGLLHGAYLAMHKALSDKFPKISNSKIFKSRIGTLFSILVTQYLVFLTWIAFRVEDFDSMVYSMQKYVFVDFNIVGVLPVILSHKFSTILIPIFIVTSIILIKQKNIELSIAKLRIRYLVLFVIFIVILITFFDNGPPRDFIYFRF